MKINRWFGLEKTICIVVGSEGLLGKSCVKALLDCGSTVIGIDIAAKCSCVDPDFFYKKLDLKSDASIKKIPALITQCSSFKVAKEIFFINCSYPRTKNWAKLGFENVTSRDWNENVNLHLGSAFRFSKFSVSFLLKYKKSGGIINFSSIYGSNGPDMSIYKNTKMNNPVPYSAIKAGIVGFTKYIATVYGKKNIRANIISPGGVENGQPKSFIRAYNKKTPLGRMANPEEIAGTCAFLASPAAKYITGQLIQVDGGWTAW